MTLFNVIDADPPWVFKDKLRMSEVKRGAESQYPVMKDQDIINLDVGSLAAKDSACTLWIPSSKLQLGMDCMKAWGFDQKQTWIWVKVKKHPLEALLKEIKFHHKDFAMVGGKRIAEQIVDGFSLNAGSNSTGVLDFGMGRLFRQTHEIVLVGTKGKVYSKLKNKSQRSVFFWPIDEHSDKPEGLQDMLDKMFGGPKLELFARRVRKNWTCVGLECLSTPGEDIRDSIERLSSGKKFVHTKCSVRNYKGLRMPTCLGGAGCSTCWTKYIETSVGR